ncbi:hypothetical protein SAMN04488539_0459 [Corynebacterium timonense]|uniref:RelA/SpoT domain-containing protein n=2 Tax=Corynebacterium timonense TaxID=441500 RepID=A0A1H1M7J2_9CORY|nr:hypothetical protein SAMN04488539_0459 [Corynebacterium timonense]
MDSPELNSHFLEARPPFSKNAVNRQGKNWRDGGDCDLDLIESFLEYNSEYLDQLLQLAHQTIKSLILPLTPGTAQGVAPDTQNYLLTARVKTTDTLRQKLVRMETTPLLNIQDVAGLRFDCDVSLSQQTKIAEIFVQEFSNAGASRVDIRDLRTSPHSGYRAIHLHIRAAAGRAEMQIRTALQSQWANLYEEAADIYGRDIRYLHEGATVPSGAEHVIQSLHALSSLINRFETAADLASGTSFDEIELMKSTVSNNLGTLHTELRQARLRISQER